MKGSRVETIEAAKKEYKELLDQWWEKQVCFLGLTYCESRRYTHQSYQKLYKTSLAPLP